MLKSITTPTDHRRSPNGTRERVITAATACFLRLGVGETRIEDIAEEANLQRPNLYRYFPNKESLILEVLVRELNVTHRRRRKLLAIEGPVAPLLAEALTLGHKSARTDDVVRLITMAREVVEITAEFIGSDPSVMAAEEKYWAPLLDHGRQRGELRPDLTNAQIIRWFLFLQFMFVERPQFFPSPAAVREHVERFVIPSVVVAPGEWIERLPQGRDNGRGRKTGHSPGR